MEITAKVDLGNGVYKASCYMIVPTAYVKNVDELAKDGKPIAFKLSYDVEIYQNKSARDSSRQPSNQIKCRKVDHHKKDYDPTTSDNPIKLANTH